MLISQQVVVGYSVNAGIVVLMILMNYLFAFDPKADPFLSDTPGAQPRAHFEPNPIDRLVIEFIREKCRIRPKLSGNVKKALEKVWWHISTLRIRR